MGSAASTREVVTVTSPTGPPGPPGSLPVRPPRWLLALVLLLALAEVVLLIRIASLIGAGATLALLIGSALLGLVVIASRRATGRGFDLLSGFLLILPGVLSTLAGLVLLAPPVRSVVRNRFHRWIREQHLVRPQDIVITDVQVQDVQVSGTCRYGRSSRINRIDRPWIDRPRTANRVGPIRTDPDSPHGSDERAAQALRRCVSAPLRSSFSRSSRSTSSSAVVRRSMSMSQWVRGGLTGLASGVSAFARVAIAPQRHSHSAGRSASMDIGTTTTWPLGQSNVTF